MKRGGTVKTDLICSLCGNIMPIHRRKTRQREMYHIKDLYCINCSKVTKHIELQEADMLKKELEFKPELNEKEQLVYDLLHNESGNKVKWKK